MLNLNDADFVEDIVQIFTTNYNNKKIPRNCIQNQSGVYIFYDSHKNEILYVGKTKLLRNRLSSYKRHKNLLEILQYVYNNKLPEEIYFGFDVYVFLHSHPENFERELIEFYNPRFNSHFKLAEVSCNKISIDSRLKTNITFNPKPFKTQEHSKDSLNPEEAKQLKRTIDNIQNPKKRVRILTMFYLLIYQDLFQFEMVNLKFEDLNFTEDFILITGRDCGKQRVNMHIKTKESLKLYFKLSDRNSGYLFTSESNNSKKRGEKITVRAIGMFFKDLLKEAGIKNKTPYVFRYLYLSQQHTLMPLQ